VIELTVQVSSVAVMIAWAAVQRSVWALLAGAVVASLVRTGLSHTVAERPDRFGWDRTAFRELFHFGKWIFLSTVLAFLVGQSDRLIFGKLIPLAMLGVYSIAVLFAALPSQLFNQLAMMVVFPALSRRAEAAGEFVPAYSRVRTPLLLAGGLPVACLIASSFYLIETLYDERYHEAGWIIQVLAMGAWFQILQIPSGSALLALGSPKWLAYANAWKLAAIVAAVPAAFWLYGIQGAVIALAGSEIVRYVVCMAGAHRHGLPTLKVDIGISALVAVLAGAGWYVGAAMTTAGSVARLAGSLGTVVVLWLPISAIVARTELRRLRAALAASFR
jgi:O-antigen/teichoic acid export membrane protein